MLVYMIADLMLYKSCGSSAATKSGMKSYFYSEETGAFFHMFLNDLCLNMDSYKYRLFFFSNVD